MYRAAGIIIVVALIGGCRSPGRRAPEPVNGPHVSVMTYNVNVGGPRADLAAEAIERSGAEIVCLQETSPAWERYLRARLAARYPHVIFRHAGGAGGMAILSRCPVNELFYEQPADGWFPGWAVVAQTPVGQLQILNVHLHPPLSDRGSVSVPAYYSTQRARRAEIEELYGKLAADVPTVVMGDFNENDGGRALRYLEQRGFRDALREFDPSTDIWRWRTSLMTVAGRYDHILYSRHLKCFNAQVLERGASDHLPVVTVLGPAEQ